MGMKIEAIFGGLLALLVLVVAVIAILSFRPPVTTKPGPTDPSGPVVEAGNEVCDCFDKGFDLAGKGVDVLSSQYRTGFELCRAIAQQEGADAWTAGWNARLSSKPYEASCRRYQLSTGRR